MTEDELRDLIAAYDAAGAQLAEADAERLRVRDEGLRRAREEGMRQVDIIRVTGYSKETVRRALNPDAREAVRDQKAARRKAGKP